VARAKPVIRRYFPDEVPDFEKFAEPRWRALPRVGGSPQSEHFNRQAKASEDAINTRIAAQVKASLLSFMECLLSLSDPDDHVEGASPSGIRVEYQMSKIKVLFLSANPSSEPKLMLDEEIREITDKIRGSLHRDSLDLVSLWAVRPDDLLQALNEHRPHVVHFSGHGSPFDEIILLDRAGQPKPVPKEALVSLFRTLRDNIRLVVLNACFSKPQAEAISELIDCTIGMNKQIGDEAAIAFAASFYRAIGFGRSVQDAFDQAKTALLLEGIPEEKTPELLARSGVNASEVFLVNP
jgi:hypothetical protein